MDHHVILTNHLLVDQLLPFLRYQNWLTPQERDMIASASHSKQKVEMIVEMLHGRNGKVLCDEVFLKCIIWSGQQDLAKLLGCPEHEIQQVSMSSPLAIRNPVSNWPKNTSVNTVPGPYPPPPRVDNISPMVKKQPVSPLEKSLPVVDVRRKRKPSSGVLHPTYIVYSKDDDPSENVHLLSDFLNYCGVDCEIDQYHAHENIVDWDQWNEEIIRDRTKKKGFVLLICSPRLHQQLSISKNSLKIDMHVGHINSLSLNALIKEPDITEHVIPVFLEQYRKEFVPSCLAGRTCYPLCLSRMLELVPSLNVNIILNTPGLESLRSLVFKLSGEPEVVKPIVTPPQSLPFMFVFPGASASQAAISPKSSLRPNPMSPSNIQTPESPKKKDRVGEVKDEFLQTVADNIGRDWSRLGVRLGIHFRTLEQIRHSVSYDIRQQAYLMLVHWKETHTTGASVVELQDKLDELKLGRIGRLLKS